MRIHLVFWALLAIIVSEASRGRDGLTVQDVARMEQIGRDFGGAASFSDDGQKVAFTRIRPLSMAGRFTGDYLQDNERGDIWVKIADKPLFAVTDGVSDKSGWWAPQWSPDGRYLSMLSTRSPSSARVGVWLWIWDSKANRLRSISSRNVDLLSIGERPVAWLDSDDLICPLLPVGSTPSGFRATQETLPEAWKNAARGEGATSVLDSTDRLDVLRRPRGDFEKIHVPDGRSNPVATYPRLGFPMTEPGAVTWQVSPDHRKLALARLLSVAPLGAADLPRALFTFEVYDLNGQLLLTAEGQTKDVLLDSLRWSRQSNRIAFFGYTGRRQTVAPALFIGEFDSRRLRPVDIGALRIEENVPARLEWTGNAALMFLAERKGSSEPSPAERRKDWWRVAMNGEQRNLTHPLPEVPRDLWSQNQGTEFVGLAGGALWRIRPDTYAQPQTINSGRGGIDELIWPLARPCGWATECADPGREYPSLLVSTGKDDARRLYRLDTRMATVIPLNGLPADTKLISYSHNTGRMLSYRSDRDGLQLWLADGVASKRELLINANTFLRDIPESTFISFEYTSLEGQSLKGWMILPLSYEPGKRYPTITWVYPGRVYDAEGPTDERLNGLTNSMNLEIPAAHGYAILLPSMPQLPPGMRDDPMLHLTSGVLPAVDKAIELGIADPQRMYLAGHSYGGFGVFGLVTQTNRFAAAAAASGFSDFTSAYGEFEASERYSEYAQEHLELPWQMELGQENMVDPPWVDPSRYVRNSPIFSAGNVQTPLLILHGDLDFLPMQQAEEFFTALYRQDKRVRLVRYWGEDHFFRNPVHAQDFWEQIYRWFDGESAKPSN